MAPNFIAERFMSWCAERAIELRYIQPGKPDQNAFIERFNRTYRTEVLNAYVFESLEQVHEISAPGCRVITKSGPMTRSQACRPPRIGPNLKPEVLP
jgi:transposase InsO family protein